MRGGERRCSFNGLLRLGVWVGNDVKTISGRAYIQTYCLSHRRPVVSLLLLTTHSGVCHMTYITVAVAIAKPFYL